MGKMPSLIILKKADHRKNELLVYCFRSCLAYSHPSKVNLLLILEKNGGKTKTGFKNL